MLTKSQLIEIGKTYCYADKGEPEIFFAQSGERLRIALWQPDGSDCPDSGWYVEVSNFQHASIPSYADYCELEEVPGCFAFYCDLERDSLVSSVNTMRRYVAAETLSADM